VDHRRTVRPIQHHQAQAGSTPRSGPSTKNRSGSSPTCRPPAHAPPRAGRPPVDAVPQRRREHLNHKNRTTKLVWSCRGHGLAHVKLRAKI
jgi:hypothetical protein